MTAPTAPTTSLQIFRETSLPLTLVPYAIYMIAPSGVGDEDYVEMYVTDSLGAAKRNVNRDDISTMIGTAISSANSLTIVADIAERDALAPTRSEFVYVVDATGDATVTDGGATYLYNTGTSAWIKTSESQSLDVITSWDSISGKPSSTPTQIDDAVAMAHTHINKTQLDQIDQDASGLLTYNGVLPLSGWMTTNW